MRKGEIACNKQFLLFSQCFLPCIALMFHFKCTLKMLSAICFNLDQSKILSSGNGLNVRIMWQRVYCITQLSPEKNNHVAISHWI